MTHEETNVRFTVDEAPTPESLTKQVKDTLDKSDHRVELVEIESWGDRLNDHYLFATLRFPGVTSEMAALDVISNLSDVNEGVTVAMV